MPVFMQAQHSVGYVGREGPLELVSLCPSKELCQGTQRRGSVSGGTVAWCCGELELSKELVVRQNWYACMFVEVSEVFVTANDVVNRDALCHRKEIEVFRVADV